MTGMATIQRNPFDLAIEARNARALQRMTVDYLQTVYRDAGFDYDACQIATATYLAWNESALKSGMTFSEFVAIQGFPADCRVDRGIESRFEAYLAERADRERIARERRRQERLNNVMLKGAVGAGGMVALSVLGIVLYRRRIRAIEELLTGERKD